MSWSCRVILWQQVEHNRLTGAASFISHGHFEAVLTASIDCQYQLPMSICEKPLGDPLLSAVNQLHGEAIMVQKPSESFHGLV